MTTLYIGSRPGQYKSIQDAVNAAQSGDTIQESEPGTMRRIRKSIIVAGKELTFRDFRISLEQ